MVDISLTIAAAPAKKRGRRTLARRPHLHGWRIQARQAPQYLLIAGGDVERPRIVARRLVGADAQRAADLKAAAGGAERDVRRRIGQRRRDRKSPRLNSSH